jgi:diguanylate cyclase (GGDEF)-like protein
MNLAQRALIGPKGIMRKLSLLIMDLDNFKVINDTFGHAAGDEVIREMGSVIKTSFRKTEIAGRLGEKNYCCDPKECFFG